MNKPTVEELEALLASEDDETVIITSNGLIIASPKAKKQTADILEFVRREHLINY